jgi:peptide/nickel transport system permease protein
MATSTAGAPGLPLGRQVAEDEAPPLSLRQMAWRRFRRHKMALFGVMLLAALIIYAFGGAFIYSEEFANFNDTSQRLQSPSAAHPFGTDSIGRDILARTIYGGQISLIIGITAVIVEVIIGVVIGAVAGYYGGKLDSLLMRFTEAMLTIPQLFILIVMAKFFSGFIPDIHVLGRTFSGSVIVIILVIGCFSWMYLARIVRAQVLSLKENEYILAARATGTPTRDIIFRHILPNCTAAIIVSATLSVGNAIVSEAYISFLGLGVRPPTATWGNMLEGASTFTIIESSPWLWVFPGLLILLTVLSINFVGDGLRDALDPRSRSV